ncbi:cation:proton antiporter [Streptomyces sp. NPDC021622]|uniref:cation:proton antiporter n=1 Tax=Streptomyces sp. NPDC021622 TaxID=3155013 RepID=UPI0033F97512
MSASDATTAVVLLDIAVVVTAAGLFAGLARRLGQPPVIGEIVAGIALGPSLLGLLPGHLTETLFPGAERPILAVLGNVGLVLFMFVVGYEIDLRHLRKTRAAVATAAAGSLLLPLAAGVGVGFLLYPLHHDAVADGVGRTAFVLFIGVALSITAFPVLARILTDFKLQRGRLGSFTTTCAAVTDVVAWALLTVVILLAVGGSWSDMALRAVGLVLFVTALALVVRPLLGKALATVAKKRSTGAAPLLLILVGLLLSAWVTTRLGFHPIFGAFAFGAAMPRDAVQAAAPEAPLHIEQTGRLFLPVFFVTTGLSVDVSGIGLSGLGQLVLVMVVACGAKFLGAAGGARLAGMDGRRSAAFGVLMNCRGLTELVVIQAGVSAGVLDQQLTTIMILMAVITTAMTAPLFSRIYDERLRRADDPVHSPGAVPAEGR